MRIAPEMRILFATRAMESAPTEGGFVLLSDLAHAMAKEPDVEVAMLATNQATRQGIECIDGFSSPGWSRMNAVEFAIAMLRFQSGFDVVHTAHAPTAVNSALMRKISLLGRRKGVHYLHTVTAVPSARPVSVQKLLWADTCVAQTGPVMNMLSFDNRPSAQIYPWPSPERVSYQAQRRQSTRGERFGDFEKVVVFPGEFFRLGIDASIGHCVSIILENVPRSCFVFACRHDTAGLGEQVFRDLHAKFSGRVFNVGEINWLIPLIEASDLVLFPAASMLGKFEPPLVLMEALTLGRSLLVSSNLSMPEGSEIDNLVNRCEFQSWHEFGKRAVEILNAGTRGAPIPEEKFQETVSAYKRCYVTMCEGR